MTNTNADKIRNIFLTHVQYILIIYVIVNVMMVLGNS